jgi:mono/diheme cytochrome c family protein
MKPAWLALPLLVLATAGCKQDMIQQPRLDTYAPSSLWRDGTSARPRPEGSIALGALARDREAEAPPSVTPELLSRGRERHRIFCAPCHGLAGDGDGIAVARGFPKPPSYHEQAIAQASAEHLFSVISQGQGKMYGFASRIAPGDRWAIVAYIRALQLSQARAAAEGRKSEASKRP